MNDAQGSYFVVVRRDSAPIDFTHTFQGYFTATGVIVNITTKKSCAYFMGHIVVYNL